MEPIVWLIIAFIELAIIVWIYNDAESNYNSGCLWLILVWFFGPLALIAYLIISFRDKRIVDHRAVNRSDDFEYRSRYRPSTRPTPIIYGAKLSQPEISSPDPGFVDEAAEKLIRDGKLSEARQHVKDMMAVAREMSDQRMIANYRKYEAKIAEASKRTSLPGGTSYNR